ncbi:MAG: M1 family aminopeptidase [Candidatus Liptonbacteria bacterium]|nr:M1 family aminopeptidase [Candidatus Liptonbacteria bacterium]
MKIKNVLIGMTAALIGAGSLFAAPQGTAERNDQKKAKEIIEFFSDEFGPNPKVKPENFSVPGAAESAARQVNSGVDLASEFLLAEKIAGSWWTGEVAPASQDDAFLSDGLAHYSAALWIEHAYGKEAYGKEFGGFVVGALMHGETPIGQAGRLVANSIEYRAVVQDKGAGVFHMLRTFLGEKTFREVLKEYYLSYRGKTARIADFKNTAAGILQKREGAQENSGYLSAFFSQWIDSTGIPEPKIEYTVMRIPNGFRIIGTVKQELETFRFPIELKIETEGNPEYKVVDVVGLESSFSVETFGKPKANGLTLDPNHKLLVSSPALRVFSRIHRGELRIAEGNYSEAEDEFKGALELDAANALAHFRYGEVFFYAKNIQAAAKEFREAINGNMRDCAWVEVWSHVYLGKIFDVAGQRERAVNEYGKAIATNDNTAGAQEEASRWLKSPFGKL